MRGISILWRKVMATENCRNVLFLLTDARLCIKSLCTLVHRDHSMWLWPHEAGQAGTVPREELAVTYFSTFKSSIGRFKHCSCSISPWLSFFLLTLLSLSFRSKKMRRMKRERKCDCYCSCICVCLCVCVVHAGVCLYVCVPVCV